MSDGNHSINVVPVSTQPLVFERGGQILATSRDVAAHFGKRHDHILRDIDAIIADAPELKEGGLPTFGDTQYIEASNGQTYRQYEMTRDGFTLLAMGFTGKKALSFKLAYIAAFNAMELELRSRPADPMALLNDPAAMRGLLLNYSEKVIALETQVTGMRGDVDAFQRIALADGSLCITDAAKALQIRPKALFDYLRSNGWIYRRPGSGHDLGYQSKTAAGLLEHKVTTVLRSDGSEKVTEQVRITPKGLTRLAQLIKPVAGAA